MSGILSIERRGQVVHATLCRPDAGNSLSKQMVAELQALVNQCYDDDAALLVLGAGGRNFCTGFDLSDLETETDDSLLARFVRVELLLQTIHAAPFTTVALGHGRIMGAGADLFSACEVRWVVGAANFCFPGAAFGLVLGTGRLARLAGSTVARDWISSGRLIEADEALAYGLATAQITAESLPQELEKLAARSLRLDPAARKGVYAASGEDAALQAGDLYALARSAARPGIKARIQHYRKASSAGRP
jgi:enoyl-CoA hydratase/carnithine racemase